MINKKIKKANSFILLNEYFGINKLTNKIAFGFSAEAKTICGNEILCS
ncbi:hypothetical protein [Xenorhabdus thailandensis]